MRAWIVNRLKGLVDLQPIVGSRVYTDVAEAAEPFIVVRMGVEIAEARLPAEARAQLVPFNVWVHDKPGSYVRIDDIVQIIKRDLPTEDGFMIGNFSVFRIKWEDTGNDGFDDHFGTNARRMGFTAMTRRASP